MPDRLVEPAFVAIFLLLSLALIFWLLTKVIEFFANLDKEWKLSRRRRQAEQIKQDLLQ